jgi:hypothetical protein
MSNSIFKNICSKTVEIAGICAASAMPVALGGLYGAARDVFGGPGQGLPTFFADARLPPPWAGLESGAAARLWEVSGGVYQDWAFAMSYSRLGACAAVTLLGLAVALKMHDNYHANQLKNEENKASVFESKGKSSSKSPKNMAC